MKKQEIIIEIPREFKPLFDTNWREAAIYGGRFSLKSHTVARYLLIRARQKKTRIACFREFQNSIAESSHQLLSDLITYYGLNDFEVTNNSIVNKINGSDFLFKGLWHNEQSIKSIEGVDVAWCFPAGTKVDNKRIEEIKVGDSVLSFNHKTKRVEKKRVLRTMRREMPRTMFVLHYNGGEHIIATGEHPFYTNRGYAPLKELREGDIIYGQASGVDLSGQGREKGFTLVELRVDDIKIYEQTGYGGFGESSIGNYVYNLEVEDNNNYFANGLLVHNCEEAQTISRDSLEVLTPTVRKEGSQIIYTYNRILEDDPVHVRLILEGRPDVLVINVNYDIAVKYGMMPEGLLKEIEDDKVRRPALYKHKWLGEPNSLERKIYKNWTVIEEVPEEARLERIWLDFGYTVDPSAIGGLYKWNNAFVVDEYLYQKGLSNKQLADVLSNLPKALVIADSAEPKSIDEIRSFGINILPSIKGKDSVKHSIQIVQEQKIFVTKRSINIIKEERNFLWMADKDGKIVNVEDPMCANHHMAGIRYALTSLIPIIRRKEYINSLPRLPSKPQTNPV